MHQNGSFAGGLAPVRNDANAVVGGVENGLPGA
jgi:hypothetical protein